MIDEELLETVIANSMFAADMVAINDHMLIGAKEARKLVTQAFRLAVGNGLITLVPHERWPEFIALNEPFDPNSSPLSIDVCPDGSGATIEKSFSLHQVVVAEEKEPIAEISEEPVDEEWLSHYAESTQNMLRSMWAEGWRPVKKEGS